VAQHTTTTTTRAVYVIEVTRPTRRKGQRDKGRRRVHRKLSYVGFFLFPTTTGAHNNKAHQDEIIKQQQQSSLL
jgi:hypothetical protein